MGKQMLPVLMTENRQLKARVLELTGELQLMKAYTIQQAVDVAQIALHDKFGFGGQRNAEFEREFRQDFAELMQMARQEEREDKAIDKHADSELWYTTAKFDRALSAALGGDCLEYTERYKGSRLLRRSREMMMPVDKTTEEWIRGVEEKSSTGA